jgi:hypothetical protein
MKKMKKQPTGKAPVKPRSTTTTPGARRLLAGTAKPKEVKLGKAKAKMIGGIIAVPSKPKSRMF